MKYQKVFELANKFVSLADETKYQAPNNIDFQKSLRNVIGQMSGEIQTLKIRNFEPKMMSLLVKLYHDMVDIYREIQENKPYAAAEKLVNYVLKQPNSSIIDNLDFLSKHHLKQTNVDFKENQMMIHPQMHSLDLLKRVALHTKHFMESHPEIRSQTTSNLPPALKENMDIVPDMKAAPEDKTNPGVPSAKIKAL